MINDEATTHEQQDAVDVQVEPIVRFDSDIKRVNTKTISSAMYQVAKEIQGGDGLANAACIEAAIRLDELNMALLAMKNAASKGEMRRIALQATGSVDDS